MAGETLHGLAKRHDIARNLIRAWVEKYEAGALDGDARAADLIQSYEARIAALERLVGKQALKLEFPKGAQQPGPRPPGAPMSVMAGPMDGGPGPGLECRFSTCVSFGRGGNVFTVGEVPPSMFATNSTSTARSIRSGSQEGVHRGRARG